MKSISGIILAALAAIIYVLTIGYFAWRTEDIVKSLNRMAATQAESAKEMQASLARTEKNIRKSVRLPSVKEWLRAIEKPLATKLDGMVGEAQRRGVEQALEKWSKGHRKQEESRWKSLVAMLRKDREAARKRHQENQEQWQSLLRTLHKDQETIRKRLQQEEKRWQSLVKALQEDREAARKQSQQEAERWQDLVETLRQDREASDKQYRETVEMLKQEKVKAQEKVKQLEEDRKRDIANLLEQAKRIDQERKRRLNEFCSKRPESVICRDLY